MSYYYFQKVGGRLTIKISSSEVNLNIYKNYEKFTNEQLEFYLNNPNASVNEVKNCQLVVPQVPSVSLDDQKLIAINELQDYSAHTLGKFVNALQIANSLISYILSSEPDVSTLYDQELIRYNLIKYNAIGLPCRSKFYEMKDAIESCTENQEIIDLVNSAKEFYDSIDYDEVNKCIIYNTIN